MNTDWRAQRQQERFERRHARGYSNPLSGAIWGLALIGIGGLFLLRNMGILFFDNIWSYWPVILIALGVSKLIAGGHSVIPGAVLTAIGSIFLLRNLDIIHGNIGSYIWPAILIAVGSSMLMRHLYGPDWFGGGDRGEAGLSAGRTDSGGSDARKLNADVIFGGIDRKFVSQEFEGGRVAVVFGGANIDLREANTQRPDIVIKADAVFGGVDLKVPDTWLVDLRGSGVFGSYEDQTHHPAQAGATPPPRLIVKGGAVFGGVTVRN